METKVICPECRYDNTIRITAREYVKTYHCHDCSHTWDVVEIVNLTPHELNIENEAGEMVSIAPSGEIARLAVQKRVLPSIGGLSVSRSTFGEITGLPEPQDGVIYVVSGLVLGATDRQDVFGVGEAIRDESLRIIGAKGLSASNPYNGISPSIKNEIGNIVKKWETYKIDDTHVISFLENLIK